MTVYRHVGKVIFDKVTSVLLIILTSWLMLLILMLYMISFQFPVLYKSLRMGKAGTPFTMFKFRTLKTDVRLSLRDRQFLLGKWLRATNLDELPQLWNVLKGEMSLVGPRPLPIEYATRLSTEQKKRHSVLPGITGLAQVNGKNSLSWDKKFALDLQYVQRLSFELDILILIKTVAVVLQMRKDVSLDEQPL